MNGRESASEVFDGLTLWPDGESQPLISTLNAIDGAITSNMAIVPNLNGSIDAFASGITQLILDISSYGAMALLRLAQLPRESGPAKSLTLWYTRSWGSTAHKLRLWASARPAIDRNNLKHLRRGIRGG